MIVTLPLPPTANLYWRIWRGRAVVSPEARAYKQTASLAARAQGLRPIIDCEVCIVMRVFRPTRRGDLDNRLKVLLDALKGVAYRDDSQVADIHATQCLDAKNPRVELEVKRVGAGKGEPKLSGPEFSPAPLGPRIRSGSWKPVLRPTE